MTRCACVLILSTFALASSACEKKSPSPAATVPQTAAPANPPKAVVVDTPTATDAISREAQNLLDTVYASIAINDFPTAEAALGKLEAKIDQVPAALREKIKAARQAVIDARTKAGGG
jgi:hypothetical protein